MARPSIITDALITAFCNKLRICGNIETAITATDGMSRRSYYLWARAVRDGGGTPLQKNFIHAVGQTRLEVKLLCEQLNITKQHFRSWQAAARWLEDEYPNEYGQNPVRRSLR